jgi:hypothetical protein
LIEQLAQFVLRLRHRQAVTGNYQYQPRGFQYCGGLFGRGAAHRFLLTVTGLHLQLSEAAEGYVQTS